MALHDFVFELMERLLADESLNITESDIRYFDAGVKLDTSEYDWEEATPINAVPTVVRNSSLIIRLMKESSASEFIRFHVGDLYRIYRTDGMDEVYKIISDGYRRYYATANTHAQLLGSLKDYEAVKNNIIVRPLNYRYHRDSLSQAVYRLHGDMAIVLYLLVDSMEMPGSDHSQLLSTKVPSSMLDEWGMTIDEALDAAIENTMRLRPPTLIKINLDMSMKRISFMDDKELKVDFTVPLASVVSTDPETNGAISAFYPGVLDRLMEITGEPYYVVFSNISEFHVHPVSAGLSLSGMHRTLYDVNLRNRPDEVLSKEIYLYDGTELKKV